VSDINNLFDLVFPVIIFLIGAGIVWLVIRFILKLAMRIFWIGCIGIFVIGFLIVITSMIDAVP
jgi:hypothetical protein